MNFDFFVTAAQIALANWQRTLIGGGAVICSLIVFLGSIKGLVFGKIQNKQLRKSLLALTSIVLVLPFTAITFLIDRINFDYYWVACAAIAPCVILVYWFYENTNLRELINKIGEKTWNKLVVYFASIIVDKDNEKVQSAFVTNVQKAMKLEEKSVKHQASVKTHKDSELNNL